MSNVVKMMMVAGLLSMVMLVQSSVPSSRSRPQGLVALQRLFSISLDNDESDGTVQQDDVVVVDDVPEMSEVLRPNVFETSERSGCSRTASSMSTSDDIDSLGDTLKPSESNLRRAPIDSDLHRRGASLTKPVNNPVVPSLNLDPEYIERRRWEAALAAQSKDVHVQEIKSKFHDRILLIWSQNARQRNSNQTMYGAFSQLRAQSARRVLKLPKGCVESLVEIIGEQEQLKYPELAIIGVVGVWRTYAVAVGIDPEDIQRVIDFARFPPAQRQLVKQESSDMFTQKFAQQQSLGHSLHSLPSTQLEKIPPAAPDSCDLPVFELGKKFRCLRKEIKEFRREERLSREETLPCVASILSLRQLRRKSNTPFDEQPLEHMPSALPASKDLPESVLKRMKESVPEESSAFKKMQRLRCQDLNALVGGWVSSSDEEQEL